MQSAMYAVVLLVRPIVHAGCVRHHMYITVTLGVGTSYEPDKGTAVVQHSST